MEAHLEFCQSVTPAESVYALDLARLSTPDITVFAARENGQLLGVGALRVLDSNHGEIKSMHTRREVRGRGVGRAMVEYIIAQAKSKGLQRISLETGNYESFESARRLYLSLGFHECDVFGDYLPSDISVCMTRGI